MAKSKSSKSTARQRPPAAIFIENQDVYIPKDVKNPILDGQSHDLSRGRVGGVPRIAPELDIRDVL